jgi:hypothetical protein
MRTFAKKEIEVIPKQVVRWLSVLAILAVGLSSGVTLAAPGGTAAAAACSLTSATVFLGAVCPISSVAPDPAIEEQVVLSAVTSSPETFAALAPQAIQERLALSGVAGNAAAASLASQPAANADALQIQEALVLSAASGSVTFIAMASQAAANLTGQ